jgi:PKD repeat protein
MRSRVAAVAAPVLIRLGVAAGLGLLALLVAPQLAAAASPQAGYVDGSISGAADAPSGSKPESKLWFQDGSWWSSMFNSTTRTFRVFRLDQSSESWANVGPTLDTRTNSRADVLFDGAHVYVASHVFASDSNHNTAGQPSRLWRLSYDSTARSYSVDAGYPVAINNVSSETLVIEKDSSGTLWATWTQAKHVFIAHSVGNDATWSPPIQLTISGTLNSDDIVSTIAFGGNKVGLLWSNQAAATMYFSVHVDGTADTAWSGPEVAASGSHEADDHINLKTDSAGRVYAAVKTSKTSSGDPLINLLVRSSGGTWSKYLYGTVANSNTRPIVLVDEAEGTLRMFATGPYPGQSSGQSGGTIYEKDSPLGSISFPSGLGTPVIQDPTSADMNNATSTKQEVDGSTGLVVLATNDSTNRYWHADLALGAPPPKPVANFSGTPTSGTAPLQVQFTDQSSNNPTSWSWSFGDGGTSTSRNPIHTYAAAGTYDVTLTATNGGGTSDPKTIVGYITVNAPAKPVANFTGTPTSGTAPLQVQFTDTSSNSPTSWSWDFGDNSTSTAQNPVHTYAAAGTYDVTLTATNAAGSSTVTKLGYVAVNPPAKPVANFTGSPLSGSAPLPVQFTDTSANGPTSWLWDFGDNTTSTSQNPSHTYTAQGTYTVSLTATNVGGSDQVTKTNYIAVSPPPATLNFNPVADALVKSSAPTGNYGTLTTIQVRLGDGSTTNPNYYGYLKFNVSGLSGAPSSVTLRLFVTDATKNGVSVNAVDSSWTETGITYANAPPISGTSFGSLGAPAAGAYVDIPLSVSAVAGNGTVSFGLLLNGGDSLIVASRETATPPILVVGQAP